MLVRPDPKGRQLRINYIDRTKPNKKMNREPVVKAVKISFKKPERQALLSSTKRGIKSRECGEIQLDVKK